MRGEEYVLSTCFVPGSRKMRTEVIYGYERVQGMGLSPLELAVLCLGLAERRPLLEGSNSWKALGLLTHKQMPKHENNLQKKISSWLCATNST